MSAVWCAVFLVLAMSTAGICQVLWLRASPSKRLQQPVDMGLTLRGRRLFGENKTVRGFVAMVPATGIAFASWCQVVPDLWPLSTLQFLGLGLAAGLGFMLGELPNSFFKRQLDVPPGEAPENPVIRVVAMVVDRVDSLLGALLALALFVPMPATTWGICLLLGPGVHALFSAALYASGVKKRAA